MIYLKNKIFNKSIFKTAFIIVLSAIVFFFASYFYLDRNFKQQAAATERKDTTVPYKNLPDNAGIAFVLPDFSAVLVYLDFENNSVAVLNVEDYDASNSVYYGYSVDFTVETDYELIGGIVDRIGGVNIEKNGETLRYTGVQVIDLISENQDATLKKQLILQIFEQFSKNNFSKEDFIYIIENSKTDLSLIDVIDWLDRIDKINKNIKFVN